MLDRKDRTRHALFIPGSLVDYIPKDHILKKVDKVLDLSWLREEVADCYDLTNGRPGIDPEAAVRLMLAGFFQGIVHDRKLIREAEVNIAIRWFAGYDLTDKLPHHSSLTRIRQRWGMERFLKIFQKTVEACNKAGLISGETIHIDATLIRADVSWESLTTQHVETVFDQNNDDGKENETDDSDKPKKKGRPGKAEKKPKKISRTDPDATMTTSKHSFHMEPSYKQHTAVDDKAGVVVDVKLTTGEQNEGKELLDQIARIRRLNGKKPVHVTADMSYAHGSNYGELEKEGIDAVIPPNLKFGKKKSFPAIRFKYDARHDIVKCPGKQILTKRGKKNNGWVYHCGVRICQACKHKEKCLSPTARYRQVTIVNGHEALLRARRRKVKSWDKTTYELYLRHKWRVEGAHGEAKTLHGLRRAVRRGLWNVAIQMYLTATVMNLKRLAAFYLSFFKKSTSIFGNSGFRGWILGLIQEIS
ncbi:MAG: IS1182 family transposase [Acidobacteria bacterium]|nr:MAG: IS1182 family transposase [Acidobacteriota bacterium]